MKASVKKVHFFIHSFLQRNCTDITVMVDWPLQLSIHLSILQRNLQIVSPFPIEKHLAFSWSVCSWRPENGLQGRFPVGEGVAPCMKPVDEEADRGRGYPPTNSDNIKSLGLADREMPWQRQQNAAQVPSRKSNGWSLCIQFEFHRRQPCCLWVPLRSWCRSGGGRRGAVCSGQRRFFGFVGTTPGVRSNSSVLGYGFCFNRLAGSLGSPFDRLDQTDPRQCGRLSCPL